MQLAIEQGGAVSLPLFGGASFKTAVAGASPVTLDDTAKFILYDVSRMWKPDE